MLKLYKKQQIDCQVQLEQAQIAKAVADADKARAEADEARKNKLKS